MDFFIHNRWRSILLVDRFNVNFNLQRGVEWRLAALIEASACVARIVAYAGYFMNVLIKNVFWRKRIDESVRFVTLKFGGSVTYVRASDRAFSRVGVFVKFGFRCRRYIADLVADRRVVVAAYRLDRLRSAWLRRALFKKFLDYISIVFLNDQLIIKLSYLKSHSSTYYV